MDLGKLQHAGWWGLVVPVGLALASTFTPGTVRGVLLFLMICAVAWTVHHTEFGARRWKVTATAAALCAVVAIPVFLAGRALDARQKTHELARITPPPGPPPVVTDKRDSAKPEQSNDARKVKKIARASKPISQSSQVKSETPKVQPSTVNNCPNGICISGGTVTSPTVINNGGRRALAHLSATEIEDITRALNTFSITSIDVGLNGATEDILEFFHSFQAAVSKSTVHINTLSMNTVDPSCPYVPGISFAGAYSRRGDVETLGKVLAAAGLIDGKIKFCSDENQVGTNLMMKIFN